MGNLQYAGSEPVLGSPGIPTDPLLMDASSLCDSKAFGKARLQVDWAVRELGESMTAMAGRLTIFTAAVSKAVRRGAEIVAKEKLRLDISL
jgi:hypothetical protein